MSKYKKMSSEDLAKRYSGTTTNEKEYNSDINTFLANRYGGTSNTRQQEEKENNLSRAKYDNPFRSNYRLYKQAMEKVNKRRTQQNKDFTNAIRDAYNTNNTNAAKNAMNNMFNFGDKSALTNTQDYAKQLQKYYEEYKEKTGIPYDKVLSLEKAYGNYDRNSLEKVKEHYETMGGDHSQEIKWLNDKLVSTATPQENRNRQQQIEEQLKQVNSRIQKQTDRINELGFADRVYTEEEIEPIAKDINTKLERNTAEKERLENELKSYQANLSYKDEEDYEYYKQKGEEDRYNKVNFYRSNTDKQAQEELKTTLPDDSEQIDSDNLYQEQLLGAENKSDKELYRNITQEEADNYAYLLGKYGEEKADEYLQEVAFHTDVNNAAGKIEEAKKQGYEHGILSSAESIGLGLLTPFEAAKNVLSGDTFRTSDDYALANKQNALRQGTAEKLSEVFGSDTVAPFIYNTSMSTADNLLRWTVASGVGSLASGTSLGLGATTTAGEGAMRGMMAGQVMDQAMSDAFDKGLSDEQAVATAIVSAFNEELFETLSIEKLKSLQLSDSTALKELVKNTGKQFVAEGSEEMFTDIGNAIADDIINGDNSEIKRNIEHYINDKGMTEKEAHKQAAIDFAMQLVESGLSGGLSGATMGGIGTVKLLSDDKTVKNMTDSLIKSGMSENEAQARALDLLNTNKSKKKASRAMNSIINNLSVAKNEMLNNAQSEATTDNTNESSVVKDINETDYITPEESINTAEEGLVQEAEDAASEFVYDEAMEDMYATYKKYTQDSFNKKSDMQAESNNNTTADLSTDKYVAEIEKAEKKAKNASESKETTKFDKDLYILINDSPTRQDDTKGWDKTADKLNSMWKEYPEMHETLGKVFDAMNEGTQRAYLNEYFGENLQKVAFDTNNQSEKNILEGIKPLKYGDYKGENVELVSVSKDNVTIKGTDGKENTVKLSELNLSEGTKAVVSQAAEYGKKGSKVFLANISSDPVAYTMGFDAIYNAGKNGQDFYSISATNVRSLSSNYRNARNLAYEVYSAGISDNTKTKKIGGLVRNENRHKISERQAAILNMMGKAFGVTIQIDDVLDKDANGEYEDGVIHISRNASNPALVVFAHEFTHRLEETSPKAYKQYEDYIINMLKELAPNAYRKRVTSLRELYASRGVELSDKALRSELAANATEMFLMDETAVNQIVDTNISIAKKIVNVLKDLIKDLQDLINSDDRYSANTTEAKIISENKEVFEKALDLWLKAIEQQNEDLIAKENAKGSEASYSMKDGIVELTGEPISQQFYDALEILDRGDYVSVETLNNTPEMIEARKHVSDEVETYLLEGREEIQNEVIDKLLQFGSYSGVDKNGNPMYNGSVRRDNRLDIIIGLPASGKSSAIINKLSKENKSMLLDNDEAKKLIPEFNGGWGAGVVHEESGIIEKIAYKKIISEGKNLVLPKVGSNSKKLIEEYIKPAKNLGYAVNVHYIDLNRNKALSRMMKRFIDDSRYLDPILIDKNDNPKDGNKIEKSYNELVNSGILDGYSKWDNDVARGESPNLIESYNISDSYIEEGVEKNGRQLYEFETGDKGKLYISRSSRTDRRSNVSSRIRNAETEKRNRTTGRNGSKKINDSNNDKASESTKRFSLKEDSEGRELSKQQQEYFKDSKVRDENGNLIVVYHGSANQFTVFKRNANYYSDNKKVADTYKINDNLYEGYLNITNPIIIDAEGEKWSMIDVSKIKIDGVSNVKKFLENYGSSTWREKGAIRTSTADIVSAISDAIDEEELNADGIIIKNIYDEGTGATASGTILGNDYITFNSNQFKSVDNTAPTDNPDIRYSLKEQAKNDKGSLITKTYDDESSETFIELTDASKITDKQWDKLYYLIDTRWLHVKSPQGLKDEALNRIEKYGLYPLNVELENENDIYKAAEILGIKEKQDTEGNVLSPQQQEYFKDSKVVDEKGNLIIVYHGTEEDFTVFNPKDKGGKNGTAEGYGIYFAETQDITSHYGEKQLKGYLNMTKPAYSWKKTIKSPQLAKLIEAICKKEAERMVEDGEYDTFEEAIKDTFVSNIVYTYDKTMRDAYKEAAKIILESNSNDMAIIQELMNEVGVYSYDDAYDFYETLEKITGFDGYITKWEATDGEINNIYVAFNSNQFKNIDNENPTSDPDIRYSLKEAEKEDRIFRTKYGVEVVKNPTDTEYRQMRDEILDNYPWLRGTDEILLRKTYDEEGNEYYWNASNGLHSQVEPYINKKYNTRTSQQYEWWKSKYKDSYPENYSDVRFSLKEDSPINNNTIAEITSKNEYLAEEIRNLEDMLTSGRNFFKANQRELFQVYDEIAKEYKINDYSKKQFADNMQLLFEYIADVDTPEAVTTMSLATMIAYDMIDTAGLKDTYMQEMYNGLDDFIKSRRLAISDQDKSDLDGGYDFFRKKYFGKLTLVKDGNSVDTFYAELNSMYPELFPEEKTHPADQLMRIGEVMDMFDSVVDNVEGATKQESAFIIARDILDKTLLNNTRGKEFDTKEKLRFQEKLRKSSSNLRRAKRDIKEEYEILLNKVKAIEGERKRLERANQRLENQMGKQMKEFADFAADEKALKKAGKLQRENERLKAKFAKAEVAKLQRKYSKERRENIEKIKKLTNQLSRSLLHPDKTHYVPRGLVASMLEVAKMIDLDSGYRNPDGTETNVYMKLKELQNQYRKMSEDGDYAISSEYNETVDKAIGRLAEVTKGKRLNELLDKDIEEVLEIMTIINYQLKTARDVIHGENLKDIKEAAELGISQIKAAKREFNKNSKLKNGLNGYLNNMLSPVRVFRRLENYAHNGVMSELGHMLEQGERKTKVIKYTAMDMLADLTKDAESRKKYEEFRTKKLTYTIGGKDIIITPDMRVALYLHSLNEQNMKHITGNKDKEGSYHGGGVIIPNYNKAMLAKDKLNLDPTEKYTGVGSTRISPETMKKIVADLTDYEKMVAEKYQQVRDYLSSEINATTMDLYGFKKATVENYFPLIVDKSILNMESEGLKFDKTLESFGFLKERVNSAKPIYLEGVMDALYRQIDQSSLFSGMAVPTRNFNKIYNYTTAEEGNENGQLTNILKESEKAFGSYITKYIDNLKSDLANARDKSTSEIARIFSRGKMATGVLTGNLSVVIKQMASYPTAAGGVLDFSDLAAGLSYQGQSGKDLTELINKYSPYLRDRNTSTIAGMNVTDLNYFQRKNPRLYYALTGWIEATDKATVRRLWYASEHYVKKNYKLKVGSDEYYEQVTEVWEDTLRRTQPIYDTMSRPEDLRQTGELKKWLMMFKTQAFQNIGIMVDSYGELKARSDDYKQNKTDINKKLLIDAQRQFRKAVASQIVQSMVFALMTAIADAIKHRPDDWTDEETGQFTAQSFLEHYGDSIISNTIGQLAYGDIIRDFTYGPFKAIMGKDTYRFDTEIIPIEVINNAVNNVNSIAKYTNKLANLDRSNYATEKEYKTALKGYTNKIVEVAEKISKDGLQYGLGLPINNVEKLINGITANIQDIAEGKNPLNVSSDKQTYNRIYNAYKAGDTSLAEDISGDMPEDKIKTQMVNRLKEEDEIKQAADYRYNGETDKYQSVIDAYVKNGFDETWVSSAINSDMNKKYGTKGSTTGSIYNSNDLARAIDISAVQGSKVASQIYKDKVELYKEQGQNTEDAKKKALGSVKSSITSQYKDRYINGSTHEKVVIRDTLIKIKVDGQQLFTMDAISKWKN